MRPGNGGATLHVVDAPVYNYVDFGQALGGPTPATLSHVSFTVEWSGVQSRAKVRDEANNLAAEFVRNSAKMEWTGSTDNGYTFVSAPIGTSSSSFAEIGTERNGSFA